MAMVKIIAFHRSTPNFQQGGIPSNAQVRRIPPGDFLIPGFVDTHNHAPQWPMRGLGQGLHILDWLGKITFPSKLSLPILYMPARPLRAAWMGSFAKGLRLLHTTVLAMLRQRVSLLMYALPKDNARWLASVIWTAMHLTLSEIGLHKYLWMRPWLVSSTSMDWNTMLPERWYSQC
jgi:hypothetical protein